MLTVRYIVISCDAYDSPLCAQITVKSSLTQPSPCLHAAAIKYNKRKLRRPAIKFLLTQTSNSSLVEEIYGVITYHQRDIGAGLSSVLPAKAGDSQIILSDNFLQYVSNRQAKYGRFA